MTEVSLAAALAVAALLLGGLIVWAYLRDRSQDRREADRGTDTPSGGIRMVDGDGPPR